MDQKRLFRNQLVVLLGAVMLIGACSDSSSLSISDQGEQVSGDFVLSVPESIMSMRALNLDALYADVVINGQGERMSGGSSHVKTFSVAPGSTLSVSVDWFETQTNDDPLALSSWSLEREISGVTAINVESADYTSTGTVFDPDDDGYSNLEERRAGSDPMSAASTPVNRPDVRIGWVNPNEVPIIDGLYDSVWNQATFNDVNGDQLSIDNLMIDQGAVRSDGDTEFRWFAMHDDTYLYVFVFGEDVDIATPIRDSDEVWNDDTVNLFIDGDNSKMSSYDGVDDRHIFIPLLVDPVNPSSNRIFFVQGNNSAPIPDFEFANCLCSSGVHTWEIKLPMAAFNIQKDVPFGFDVQLDEDNDGGSRDARWGWFHPSRTTGDVDNTWVNPSFMGTAVVE